MQRKIVFRAEYLENYVKPKTKMPEIFSRPLDNKPVPSLFDTVEKTLEVASFIVDDDSKLGKAINLGKELFKIFKL